MLILDILHDFLPAKIALQILVSVFLAILFLQSGLDKVFNWKDELGWLTEHFAKTFLKGSVSMMLGVVMITELLAGAFCAIGVIELLFWKTTHHALLGAELSALNIVMLFFGQRIAKDYVGAATLVNYFVLIVLAITLLQ